MDFVQDYGKIILLNGASSSGKTTLALALQERLEEPFWHFSIDHLREAKVIPIDRIRSGEFDWASMRSAFFEGFHRCLPALAKAGNNLIVEHIVENKAWMNRLLKFLSPFDVFFIGLHCPLDELERRETERRDRRMGDARADYSVVHTYAQYDLELCSTDSPKHNVDLALSAWRNRKPPSAFEKMASSRRKHDA